MDLENEWKVGVVTTKRIVSTLDTSLESIDKAGWSLSTIVSSRSKTTAMDTWIKCLSTLMLQATESRIRSVSKKKFRFLICEDDVLLSENLRNYLDSTTIPDGVVSLYTASSNHNSRPGWHAISNVPRHAHGALTYVFDEEVACDIVDDAAEISKLSGGATDRAVGYFCKRHGIPYWCHSPSFVYHLGEGLSVVDDGPRLQDGARNCAIWLKSTSGFQL